jgi:hypothetical protein
MLIILGSLSFIFLALRVIYFKLAEGGNLADALIYSLNRIKPMRILFPFKYSESEDLRIRKLKRVANMFLYLFLLSFLIFIVYGWITEFPKFENL